MKAMTPTMTKFSDVPVEIRGFILSMASVFARGACTEWKQLHDNYREQLDVSGTNVMRRN